MATTVAGPRATTTAPSARKRTLQRASIGKAALYTVLILYGIFSLAPFVYSILSSFKTYADINSIPPTLLPHPFTSASYQEIFTGNFSSLFPRYILNSFVYAIGAALFNILFGSMAGYAFARMSFPGKNVLFALTLAVLMIPANLIIIPKFLVAYTLHMADTYAALIVPAMVSPVSVILMTQFLKALPRELEESARIDGAGRVRTFFQIILPLVRPAMTAVGLLAFQGAWNDFLWPLLVMSSQQNYTLNVGLAFFKGLHYTQYQLLLAGATISLLPLVVVFFIFQRYFMQGIATAGLAGR